MGQYYSQEFKIWARKLEDDSWVELHEVGEGNPMSRFKHEVYAAALKKRYGDKKALYLYCGYNRIAKMELTEQNETPYVVITFTTPEAARQWDSCKEQINKVYVDMEWLEHSFSNHYVEMNDTDAYGRRYQNYKLSMKK